MGAYLWMGKSVELLPGAVLRTYPSRGMVVFFTPAAWVESKVRGVEVKMLDESEFIEDIFE